MENTKPEASAKESPLKTALFFLIAAIVMYFPLSMYFHWPTPFGENALERSLRAGSSTKEQYASFMEKGGLKSESSWKGYGVKSVTPRYYDDGKLEGSEIVLGKKMRGRDTATFENLKVDLAPVCGGKWETSTDPNVNKLSTERKGFACSMEYQGDDTVVNIAKQKQ